MGKLDGKVAIVTGAGRGIGEAIVLALAGAGADIVLAARTQSQIDQTAEEVRALGRRALPISTDVTVKNQVQNLVDKAIADFSKIDILVNNAGVTKHGPLLEMTEQDWDTVINADLKGVFLCTQAVGRHMVKQKYGKIINIGSAVSQGAGDETQANYAAAKTGVIGLTKVSARAFGPYGINVNIVAPGSIVTDLGLTRRTPEEYKARIELRKKLSALGRVGSVEDIASVVLFMASDESSFMTGQVISVDGGRIDKL